MIGRRQQTACKYDRRAKCECLHFCLRSKRSYVYDSLIRRQRRTDYLFAVTDENVTVGIRRRRPDDVPPPEWERRFQYSHSADFVVALRRETRANQLPLVGVQKHRVSVRRDMNARTTLELGHRV